MTSTALVVDDEVQMVSIISFALETQGFSCVTAHNTAEAWKIVSHGGIDLIVLDVIMPNGSGVELTRRIRAHNIQVPIILLTALGEERDRIAGLEAGADDYVTKPFSPRELALRASAILRRSSQFNDSVASVGELSIDRDKHHIQWKGQPLNLSATEYGIMDALARRQGEVVTTRDLLNEVWGTVETVGGRDMVKTTIYRLRKHLAEAGVPATAVTSERGIGYRLFSPDMYEK